MYMDRSPRGEARPFRFGRTGYYARTVFSLPTIQYGIVYII